MTVAAGTKAYTADVPPVKARGVTYTKTELTVALGGSVSEILWDVSGTANLLALLTPLSTTEFSDKSLKRVLSHQPVPENWRVGEAIAEAFLVEHRDCQFPWPSGRDLKNPAASPAGTDLVGFQQMKAKKDHHRFAFGEVKTSEEEKWPPAVMKGRHGLQKQLEVLRDSTDVKAPLVKYLGHRANGTEWFPKYQSAARRYLANSTDISLFGILVRDVEPKAEDLKNRAKELAVNCPSETSIELRAMYLPRNSIPSLAQLAVRAREGGHG
jgi:hypothetical protein